MATDDEIRVSDSSRCDGEHSVGVVVPKTWRAVEPPDELELDCGERLSPITVAYETYGELNAARDNAILVEHALSGDAHVAGYHHPDDRKPGWWDLMVGPGKPLDTRYYYVICTNVLGGCKGTTGPSSIDPRTGEPYGLSFPLVTIGDMVRVQERLVSHLGIRRLLTVIGGSMGGMQALDWAVRFPDRVASVIALATTARLSAQAIAFNEVGRQAIMADPNWMEGNYYGKATPSAGLAIARMIGHITYLSDESMHAKFGRRLQNRDRLGYGFGTEFQVESYLRYQGDSFVRRFDANSYLYITKANDYFDLANGYRSLLEALERVEAEFLVVSFSSDWLFPTYQSKDLVRALQANGVPTTFMEIPTSYGHDAFLLENAQLAETVTRFLNHVHHHAAAKEPAR
ncbi:MAG: homoserine O-acetyltransferase [Chloroflexi bacterium]|nr:homoserine O-acetyltransferase [Chloroflexota bacterium]